MEGADSGATVFAAVSPGWLAKKLKCRRNDLKDKDLRRFLHYPRPQISLSLNPIIRIELTITPVFRAHAPHSVESEKYLDLKLNVSARLFHVEQT